jgi:molecular chaperone DnaK (HSP70)
LPDSPNRYVHLGIDYGTSASKIVVRDYGAPGGDQSVVLTDQGSYRVPSALAVDEGFVLLGSAAAQLGRRVQESDGGVVTVLESVKMRMARDLFTETDGGFFAPEGEAPAPFSWQELATVSVWWLLSLASRFVARRLPDAKPRLGMTLGVPMQFYEHSATRAAFLDVARSAWGLLQRSGPLRWPWMASETAKKMVAGALYEVGGRPTGEDEVKLWIRSEAEAALLWPFKSPGVAEGPYVCVDVGAGTTNTSLFRMLK